MTGARHVILEADGGSRGNPGPAGYGAALRDTLTGDLLVQRSGALEHTTNNVAEYTALLEGLRAAKALGAVVVEVRMDSKLVVEQMSGRWKIRNASLRALADEARNLAAEFDEVSYEWIPRERNTVADRLANEAMDERVGATVPAKAAEPAPIALRESPARDSVSAPGAQTAAPASWSGSQGVATRLVLLRHGQTEYSVARRYSGRGDPELTYLGRRQAALAADRLGVAGLAIVAGASAVVSSPLLRARQTAGPVATALRLPVTVTESLTETDFGAWEGLTFGQAAERDPELHRSWLVDPSVPAPGGESFDAVYRRVARARDELLAEHRGGTVIVVSHVTPIKSLLRMALQAGPSALFTIHLDLASLCVVEFYADGHTSVRLVNDTAHLQ